VWLEVTYQGLAPPTDLFADLALVGWVPPTPAPPPHEAIDWSTPDEVTGERFTLRDYTVAAAVVQPPAGSAGRGTWTDAERAAHLAALRRVLDRHAGVELDDPAALVRPPAPPAPGLPPPPAPIASAPTAADAPPFTPSPGATAVLVTAPIKPSLAPRAEDLLVALGVTVVFDSQERVRTERYRGATYETTVTELHLAAIAPPDRLDAVAAGLVGLGLRLTYAEVDGADLAPDGGPEPHQEPGPDEAVAPAAPVGREGDLACVVALADPRRGDAVAGVIRSLGLVDASVRPTTRIEVSTYRGSRSEREVPSLRVEARVPQPHARLVANHLAEAAHLRIEDTSRLWIEAAPPPPPPVPVPEPPPAHNDSRTRPPSPAPPPPTARAAGLDPTALTRRPVPAFVDHGR
jgi:hypothetical protein